VTENYARRPHMQWSYDFTKNKAYFCFFTIKAFRN